MSKIDPLAGLDEATRNSLEAAAFRRLVAHLRERTDVQNITLMIEGGFCRNCLADWLAEGAAEAGVPLDKEAARTAVYGMPYPEWKAMHGREATPEELAAFEDARRRHG
ncbi:MAG: DUF1244 domain-containing protein [Alphaproteobacteria bacterium]|nr:DUF1244 domain-containing protein [Alphaproteobacteria bacterium]